MRVNLSKDDKRLIANAFMAYKQELHRCIMETCNADEKEYYQSEVWEIDLLGDGLNLDIDYFQMEA
jgi:hypothetical protein